MGRTGIQYCKAFCQTLRNSSKHTIFSQATHHNPRNAALYKTKHFQEWGQSAVGKGSVHYIAYSRAAEAYLMHSFDAYRVRKSHLIICRSPNLELVTKISKMYSIISLNLITTVFSNCRIAGSNH